MYINEKCMMFHSYIKAYNDTYNIKHQFAGSSVLHFISIVSVSVSVLLSVFPDKDQAIAPLDGNNHKQLAGRPCQLIAKSPPRDFRV